MLVQSMTCIALLKAPWHFARRYRYALQCDVEQFFPAIDHAILRRALVRKLRSHTLCDPTPCTRTVCDPDLLWLIDRILESGVGILAEAYRMHYFPGDKLWAEQRPRGLPIGNLTSQFWANVYLNPFDHFVKRELRCPAYLRYVDDFVLFADDKPTLRAWHDAIVKRLERLRLTIHPGAQPRPVTEGLPFLGFILYPTHRRLKRRRGLAYRRRLHSLWRAYRSGETPLDAVTVSVRGWSNYVRYGDTWGLRRAMFANLLISRTL